MMLVEIIGPDPRTPNRRVVYYRTVIEGDVETQRVVGERLRAVLPSGHWRAIFRPLGSLDGIVEALRERSGR